MGTRLVKQIGWFMPAEIANTILDPYYDDKLEYIDSQSFSIKLKESLTEFILADELHRKAFAHESLMIGYRINKQKNEEGLIQSIYHLDTFQGLLFQNALMEEATQRNLLIDSIEAETFEFKIIPVPQLNQLTYGYNICIEELSKEEKSACDSIQSTVANATIGDYILARDIEIADTYLSGCGLAAKFKPMMPVGSYLAVALSGILTQTYTHEELTSLCQPVIIYSWG